MTELLQDRKEKEEFFRLSDRSPLTDEQKLTFTGLRYFPENPALSFRLPVEAASTARSVKLRTSAGDLQEHEHRGSIRFVVGGKECTLQVYGSGHGYFIPFVDATAPSETYGAGRYLEAHAHGDGLLHVDFNLAYNPYCAYNDRWSCPLPPTENRLTVRIEAGEKSFHD